MQFSVDDKVVHPRHGAGRITGIQQRQVVNEARHYFVIEIPAQRLTIYVPSQQMESLGVRLAMPLAKMGFVLDTLRGLPGSLPADHQQRQAVVWEKLDTGLAIQLAEVVRDLTWYRRQAHLTKKDSEYLSRGRELLAAEMALAADTGIAEANHRIDDALEAGLEALAGS
jgi:CarD family transcriptional regulator